MRKIGTLGAGLMLAGAVLLVSTPATHATVAQPSVAAVVASVDQAPDAGVSSEEVLAAFLGFLTGAVAVGGANAAARQQQGKKAEAKRAMRSDTNAARSSLAECLGAVRALYLEREIRSEVDVSPTITSAANAIAQFQVACSALGLGPEYPKELSEALRKVLVAASGEERAAQDSFEGVVDKLLDRLDDESRNAA